MPAPKYFKRYRMERELRDLPPVRELPRDFEWWEWSYALVDIHAEVKFLSFRDEIDTFVFPSLGHVAGCRELMHTSSTRAEFGPEGTWMIARPFGACATVQGVREKRYEAIQYVGVVSDHRGRGLGTRLLLKAVHDVRLARLSQAYLDVTARNELALR